MVIRSLGSPRVEQLLGPSRFGQTLGALAWTLDRLRQRGVAPGPASRLHRLAPALEAAANVQDTLVDDVELRRVVAEAQRTVFEFAAIANILPADPGAISMQLHRKFQRSYGGHDDPALDGPRQIVARSTQFELWLAAFLVAGGLAVCPAEPDLVLWYDSRWRGVAAKRVRSRSQILRRVKDAAAQVRRSTGGGFVALSLDNFADSGELATSADSGVKRRVAFIDEFPEIGDAATWVEAKAPWIQGMLCFGQLARWHVAHPPAHLELDNLVHLIALNSDVAYFNSYFSKHADVYSTRMKAFTGSGERGYPQPQRTTAM